ncbi:MAG: hypothetical protein GX085_03725 [Firmicutes bacterium]|nr:hypothetical protein [Bacillota bacterium]
MVDVIAGKKDKKVLWLLLLLVILFFVIIFFLFSKGLVLGGDSVRLVELRPASNVGLRANLTFSFSRPVVAGEEVGKTIDRPLVRFTPEVPGKFRWVSRQELLFLPEVPFRPSTSYSAEINPGLFLAERQHFSGRRKVEFSTPRIKVDSAGINLKAAQQPTAEGLVAEIRISFNHPVDHEELQKHLQLRFQGGRAIGYHLQSEENNRSFLFVSEPLARTEKQQVIELILPKGFRGREGDLGLANDFKTTRVIGEKKTLAVVGVAPENDESSFWIVLNFTEPPELDSIANFIQIRPEVSFRVEGKGNTVLVKSNNFQPDTNYSITVLAGLPALDGHPLARDFSQAVTFKDLEPSLSFNSPGRYLSSRGHLNLGLETVNVDRVNLEIRKIYGNNLVTFFNNADYHRAYYSYGISHVGKVIKSEVIEIPSAKNQVVTTPISLGEYLTGTHRGFFQVVAYDHDYRWRRDLKNVIITDLGMIAKMSGDDLLVWVNSLTDLKPKPRVHVTLFSKNNQTMATATTDNQGVAVFRNLRSVREEFDPFIILAEEGDDFSFIKLDDSRVSLADFDTRGRPTLEKGYETFIYMDRDIFRPGDTANLVTVVRGPQVTVPPEFPVRLEIRQPDGQIFRELLGNTRDQGICEFSLSIPEYAQTGKYSVRALIAEEATGSASFSVEEFMPDRIKVTLTADRSSYSPASRATILVEGVNLFGPPAAGRRAAVKVTMEAKDFRPAGYASYTFGDRERSFTPVHQELGEKILDDEGRAEFSYLFPMALTPPAMINAIFQATVSEEGGRAVSAYQSVNFYPYRRYIGIKRLSEGYGQVGREYAVGYVVLNREGQPIEVSSLVAEVYRITWQSVYRRDAEGRYRFQSVQEKIKVHSEELPAASGEQVFRYTPKDYGRYQIVIRDTMEKGVQASLSFYASGWGYAPWAMDNPDKVQLTLDKSSYRPGETAQAQIQAPFAGKALVTVEREKVYSYQMIDLPENTGVVSIPVKEEYLPNVYLTIQLLRAPGDRDQTTPARAFGTIPLPLVTSGKKLDLRLEAPDEIRPHTEIKVKISAPEAGEGTRLTLAAVDEGICQLTGYTGPDPMGFFYGKKQLEVASYDLYGMLLPEVEPAMTPGPPAGGMADEDAMRRRHLTPVSLRRVIPVSLWSGILTLNKEKEAEVSLKIPQFNGTLRLMAVAFDGDRVGAVQDKRIVRDPVVLTPTFPRFVAPRDQFTIPVSVFNGTGEAGQFQLTLTADGPVTITGPAKQSLDLAAGEEKSLLFTLKAGEAIGKVSFTLTASGKGLQVEHVEELPVRPPVPFTQRLFSGTVTADKPLVMKVEDEWFPGTEEYTLTLAPFPDLQLAGSLRYLLQSPYGCLEQVTSKLFPLLYFDDLARIAGSDVFKGGNAAAFLQAGIEIIESMSLRDGSFLYWPGGIYSNRWSSIYATHFLVEARKAGYAVADRVYKNALSHLQFLTKGSDDKVHSLQCRVYALYVLSLAGRPQLSTMTYIKNHQLGKLSHYSRAQLAAAYFYAGDRETALSLLPATTAASSGRRETGGSFNSPVRADAIILGALADIDPANPAIYRLVDRLSQAAKPGRWGTTQENAFALMALGKIAQKKTDGDYKGEVLLDGSVLSRFDSDKEFKLSDTRLAQGELAVRIEGEGECYYFLNSSGVPRQLTVAEDDRGLAVRREYLDTSGRPLARDKITQGDLVIAEITITAMEDNLENIAIVDLLPAGLEIENPRLQSRESIPWLAEEGDFPVDYMDIRDDRLLLFTSLRKAGTYRFYYALRAVTCGEFFLPPIKAECIYEPEIQSVADSGYLTVIPRGANSGEDAEQ